MKTRTRVLAMIFVIVMLFVFWNPPQPITVSPTDSGSSEPTKPPTIPKPEPKKEPPKEAEVSEKRPDRKPHACPETFFTAADILAHKKCDFGQGKYDLWLVINENVYDVTEWAPYHPGGMLICHARGIDGTKLFKSSHQDWVAKTELPKWCIGKLQSGELEKLPASVPEEN